MKGTRPISPQRLPVDFGDEPICVVPVQRCGGQHIAAPAPWQTISLSFCSHPVSWAAFALANPKLNQHNPKFRNRGFTLVEILVVLALLSLIVFALMAVFGATQKAFRNSLTQTDSLESGRAVMDLIAGDLATMTPSYGISNIPNALIVPIVPFNFLATVKTFPSYPPSPLYQTLVGSPDGATRTNVLEDVFILGKGNIGGVPSWIGSGYSVNTNLADGTLYPLYRFYMTTNASSGAAGQYGLYVAFALLQYTNSAIWSHMMDGVVNLTARAYDTNGVWMTNGYVNTAFLPLENIYFVHSTYGEVGCAFYSNAVPAAVQVELGTMEDRTLAHAEGLSGAGQSNYLAGAAGQVHLFDRRVWIRNLDLSAYQ